MLRRGAFSHRGFGVAWEVADTHRAHVMCFTGVEWKSGEHAGRAFVRFETDRTCGVFCVPFSVGFHEFRCEPRIWGMVGEMVLERLFRAHPGARPGSERWPNG